MKRVAWPPVGPHMAPEIASVDEHDNGTASVLQQNGAEEIMQHYQNDTNRFSKQHQVSPGAKVAPPVPPKPGTREIANAQVKQPTVPFSFYYNLKIIPLLDDGFSRNSQPLITVAFPYG